MSLSNTKTRLLGSNVQQFKILILLTIGLVSCNFKQNSILIKDINPKKSEKIVRVNGTVKKIVPLIRSGSYQLQDDTGSIWVITSSSLPTVGSSTKRYHDSRGKSQSVVFN